MRRKHFIGEKITLINNGAVPENLQDLTTQIRQALMSRKTAKKMATYLFHVSDDETIEEAWVAISGFGNRHQSDATAKKVNPLDRVNFIPYLEHVEPAQVYELADEPENIMNAVIEDSDADWDSVFDERKTLFLRFLITATNKVSKSGVLPNAFINRFSLSEEHIRAILTIHSLLRDEKTKSIFQQHIEENYTSLGREEAPIYPEIVVNTAFLCYIEDTLLNLIRLLIPLDKSSPISHWSITDESGKDITDFYESSYKATRQKLGWKKGDLIYSSCSTLWEHCRHFSMEALMDMLKHCAETNMIAYLEDYANTTEEAPIFSQDGKFILFSMRLDEEEFEISPFCDVCMLKSLPDIIRLNAQAGDTGEHMMVARIPVTIKPNPEDLFLINASEQAYKTGAIDLSNTPISIDNLETIFTLVRCENVKKIILRNCSLKHQHAEKLIIFLRENKTLEQLDVSNNPTLSQQDHESLVQVIATNQNTTLLNLTVDGPNYASQRSEKSLQFGLTSTPHVGLFTRPLHYVPPNLSHLTDIKLSGPMK